MKPVINISNYEEFFLLYVDGELSAAEKQAIEQFVQENPHLAQELDMLQQVKLPAEDWEFTGKETLLKNEGEEINLENHETHFLLYVDNELGEAGKTSVETFVLQHPSLQEQFMLLKKTKLEPETIVFPNKESLYRKEEKERRVVYMNWQRMAIAAVFIGVIALVWTFVPSDNNPAEAPMVSKNPGSPVITKPNVVEPVKTEGFAQVEKGSVQKNNNVPATTGTVQQPVQKIAPENIMAQAPVTQDNTVEPQQRAVTARHEQQQTINTVSNSGGIINNPPVEINNAYNETGNGIVKTELAAVKNEQPENTAATIAQPAVYKQLDTETEDNRKSLYVGSIEINKDKLRGFFRKATSLFRGKAKQQEDEKSENAPSSSNTRSLK